MDYVLIAYGVPFLFGFRVLSFLYFKTYTGIIFHTGIEDAKRIFFALLSVSLSIGLIFNGLSFLVTEHFLQPTSILVIEFMVTIFLMIGYRGLVKVLYLEMSNVRKERRKVVIYGAGQQGILTKQVLDRDAGTNYSVSAFVDDNAAFKKKRINGIEIFSGEKLERVLFGTEPDMLVFAAAKMPTKRKQEVVELCLKYKVKVRNVPPVEQWMNGELSFQQIKEIHIEDLLERAPIELDETNIAKALRKKRVLITGAAGSIGSELARQVARFQPKQLLLLDQAETPLHELELEFRKLENCPSKFILADIRSEVRMTNVFKTFRPDVVFHAAAYKHVPVVEHNPSEAILTNIKGTQITADLAVEYGVEKFVLVSTDKAVNPTSVMGATKRMAEIYVQSFDKYLRKSEGKTRFITTRFGNVLGSSGSVIPLFKKQIADGGPVTITHPEITRYFMTIPEACLLVLEAGAMGKGGEIFVFDMGESIKIIDLAKRMIRLSGLEPTQDISITFTGLRPGEKLYEEVLNEAEKALPTHHKKILIARVRKYGFKDVQQEIETLKGLHHRQDNQLIIKQLKQFIPEYQEQQTM